MLLHKLFVANRPIQFEAGVDIAAMRPIAWQ